MSIKSFKDLRVWQKSFHLGVQTYKLVHGSKHFALKDQMQRASLSIPSNIAEGFDRTSNKEYIYFLKVARGSCSEPRTQLEFAKEVGVLSLSSYTVLDAEAVHVRAMIQALISARKKFRERSK